MGMKVSHIERAESYLHEAAFYRGHQMRYERAIRMHWLHLFLACESGEIV